MCGREPIRGPRAERISDAEAVRHLGQYERRVVDPCEIDEGQPLSKLWCDRGRDLERQTSLAHSWRTSQGHQPVIAEEFAYRGDLRIPTDQPGGWAREYAGRADLPVSVVERDWVIADRGVSGNLGTLWARDTGGANFRLGEPE
jgi:hypothetical protein